MVSNLRNFGRIWLASKKKYKVLMMEYKNDKLSNEILGHDRKKCPYYEYMDI